MHEKIGILGPDTPLGTRIIEHFHLANKADVIPICEDASHFVVNSRFDLATMEIVEGDIQSLKSAFGPCDTLVYCTDLNNPISTRMIETLYHGANLAGVYRMVFVSTAFTLGPRPLQRSSEWSLIKALQKKKHCKLWQAVEDKLMELRAKSDMDVVILKPGFVYGPRTQIITHFANALLQGSAFWYKQGEGVFNGIYIDNLIEAIEKALVQKGDGQAFLLVDPEPMHWHSWMVPVAKALGFEPHNVLIDYNHKEEKRTKGHQINRWLEQFSSQPETFLDLYEAAMLCHWKIPQDKAVELLEYKPTTNFADALAKTIEWLRFAGYPVQTKALPEPEYVLYHND